MKIFILILLFFFCISSSCFSVSFKDNQLIFCRFCSSSNIEQEKIKIIKEYDGKGKVQYWYRCKECLRRDYIEEEEKGNEIFY